LLAGLGAVVILTMAGLRAPADLILRLNGGRPLSYWSAPELFDLVARLSARAEIATPRLYLLPSPQANAMAAGADPNGSLAVTSGALRLLRRDELEGVIAHEIAHLQHGDTATMQLANTIARAVGSLLRIATWIALFSLLLTGAGLDRLVMLSLLGLFVPVVIGALRAALSRTRELVADATAAELTGKPWALASALAKLERQHASWLDRLLGRRAAIPEWLRSHPSTAERVRRLLQLGGLPA
jgi:heat shock protein HtpX